MTKLAVLTLTLLSLPVSFITAQANTDMMWYWAWRSLTGELVAYNVDGEIHVLLNTPNAYKLRRLDHQTAIVMAQQGDSYNLYLLTDHTAQPILTLFEDGEWQEPNEELRRLNGLPGFSIRALRLPYVVLVNDEFKKRLIYNVEDGTINELVVNPHNVRFSRNGQQIRYMVWDDEELKALKTEGVVWTIREYELETEAEHIIYTQYVPETDIFTFSGCYPNEFAERWLCQTYFDELNTPISYWILLSDGSIQPIETSPKEVNIGIGAPVSDLVLSDYDCRQNCHIKVYPAATSSPILFPWNDADSVQAALISSDILYVRTSGLEVFLVSPDGMKMRLGHFICCGGGLDTVSNDLRWNVLIEDARTVLWDTLNKEKVLDIPGYLAGGSFLKNGFIGTVEENLWAYSFSDERLYQLPDVEEYEKSVFFDILSDGVFLYEVYLQTDGTPPAIYKYVAEMHEFILLVPGAQRIYATEDSRYRRGQS